MCSHITTASLKHNAHIRRNAKQNTICSIINASSNQTTHPYRSVYGQSFCMNLNSGEMKPGQTYQESEGGKRSSAILRNHVTRHRCMAATSMQMLRKCYSLRSSKQALGSCKCFFEFTLRVVKLVSGELFYVRVGHMHLSPPTSRFFFFFTVTRFHWLKMLTYYCLVQAMQATFRKVFSCYRTSCVT